MERVLNESACSVKREKDVRKDGVDATVVELMPAAAYRLKLENEDLVVAHSTGASGANFVRLRPGDRVRLELSPHDRTRGRIVELLNEPRP
jgi:translation initiation factor IF-1